MTVGASSLAVASSEGQGQLSQGQKYRASSPWPSGSHGPLRQHSPETSKQAPKCSRTKYLDMALGSSLDPGNTLALGGSIGHSDEVGSGGNHGLWKPTRPQVAALTLAFHVSFVGYIDTGCSGTT